MIRGRSSVGTLPNGCHVYNINKVSMLSLDKEESKDLDIEVKGEIVERSIGDKIECILKAQIPGVSMRPPTAY